RGPRPDQPRGDRPRPPRDRDDRPRRDRDHRGGSNEGRTYSFDSPKGAEADADNPFAVLAKLKLGKS
ncbi:hypothetical protein HMPREF9946_03454, partial [Acetobacteraceae bacterium AT-5844]